MRRTERSGNLISISLGFGAGLALALLFAPKSGYEMRKDISEGVRHGIDTAGKTVKKVTGSVGEYVSEIKESITDAVVAGKKSYAKAKET